MDRTVCAICKNKKNEEIVKVTARGLPAIINASKQRGDDMWHDLEETGAVFVHKQCRKTYTHPTELSKFKDGAVATTSKFLRSAVNRNFDLKSQCFFCEAIIHIKDHKKYNKHKDYRQVATVQIKSTVIKRCRERNDAWSNEVFNRINNEIDLVASEAVYHTKCHRFFMREEPKGIRGRPVDSHLEDAFEKLCISIENDSENCQFSIKELSNIMASFLPENEQTWSEKNLKMRLKNKYKDNIIMTSSLKGKQSIVSFRGTCEKLLSDEWSKHKMDDRLETVISAARILREDIRGMTCNLDNYPSLDDMRSGGTDKLLDSLNIFFSELVLKGKKNNSAYKTKVAAIENFIVSLVRVRSYISPVMFGLGTLLHRKYASKTLIDALSSIGVSVSYSESLHFESSAINSFKEIIPEDSFLQFVFDNADVNTRTIDGHGTFHSMGGIMCITPPPPVDMYNVPRPKSRMQASEIGHFGSIPVKVRSYRFIKLLENQRYFVNYRLTANQENRVLRP